MIDSRKLDLLFRRCLASEQNIDFYNPPPGVHLIDVHFMKIALDVGACEAARDEFMELLADWPSIMPDGAVIPALKDDPNYVYAGHALGEPMWAFVLFAIGEQLGLWTVLTPQVMGVYGIDGDELAQRGLVSIHGYQG